MKEAAGFKVRCCGEVPPAEARLGVLPLTNAPIRQTGSRRVSPHIAPTLGCRRKTWTRRTDDERAAAGRTLRTLDRRGRRLADAPPVPTVNLSCHRCGSSGTEHRCGCVAKLGPARCGTSRPTPEWPSTSPTTGTAATSSRSRARHRSTASYPRPTARGVLHEVRRSNPNGPADDA